jgi:fermentation-respiration switch protein FrsA (DUF1100 family)
LLLIHGTNDPVAPYQGATRTFADAPRPKFLLSLIAAPHVPFAEPFESVVVRSSIDFFDRYLRHRLNSLCRLHADANVRWVSALQRAPSPGRCDTGG